MLAGSLPQTSAAGPAAPGEGLASPRGRLVLDRYSLEERIGRGGMAEVFRGKLTRVGGFVRDVAIKVLLPQLAGEPEFIHMMMDEARIAATINHPNVVQVLDVGQQGDTFCLVMEYIDGTDLRSVERRHAGGAVPLEPLLFIIAEVLRGLEAIHSACDATGRPLRVIHRDVTPSNVLITRSGAVKLADFGIAHATGRLTQTQHGAVKGKTRYMAPEQLEGGTIDHRSDLFAVGVVFLEALLGRAGSDAWHATGMGPIFRLPARIPAGLPPEVERALRRALAEDPADRYPSAAAFRRDVLRALHARCADRGDEVDFAADELSLFLQEVLSRPDPRAGRGEPPEAAAPPGGEGHAADEPSATLSPAAPAAKQDAQQSLISQQTLPLVVGPPAPPPSAAPTMLLPSISGGAVGSSGGAPRDISQDSTAISQASALLLDLQTEPRGPQPGDFGAAFSSRATIPRELMNDPMAAPLLEEGSTGVARRAPRSAMLDTVVRASRRRPALGGGLLLLLGVALAFVAFLLIARGGGPR